MDVSACPLLRRLYLTDVCGAQGWIRRGKLLVRVDVGDKVHIIFCLTEGRKWKWQLGAPWWLWFWCEMEIEADLQHVRHNCQVIVCLWGNIFTKCDLSALLHSPPPGFNVWTRPSLHVFVYVPAIERRVVFMQLFFVISIDMLQCWSLFYVFVPCPNVFSLIQKQLF